MSYDNFAQTFSKSRKNHPWPEIDYIIDDMKKQGYSSVLDIGCGNGRFIEQFCLKSDEGIMPAKFEYLGIDSSTGMIEEACKLHPHYQFEVCPMKSILDYPTIQLSNYSAIIFLASFHHLETQEERIQVLKDVKKLLKPNGRVYMTNWNLVDQPRYKESHRGNGEFDIKIGTFSRYYHGFTSQELADIFGETSYQIIENRIFEGGRNFLSILSL